MVGDIKPEGETIPEATSEDKPKLSVLEETKLLIEELKKEKADISIIKDELQKLRSDQLLSGTGGGRVETVAKEETPKEYRTRINKEISEGKTEFGN